MATGFRIGEVTLLRFRGKDRCRVINNLCTQDLRKLSHGEARETFVTDVKGRCFGHGVAFALRESADDASNESCYFLSVPKQGERLVPHFDRYIIREDAVIEDVSQAFDAWLFADIESAAIGLGLTNVLPDDKVAATANVSRTPIMLVPVRWIGKDSVLSLVPRGTSDQEVASRLDGDWHVCENGDRTHWEPRRIAAFWPWYGVDFDERNLPQEADRNDLAISFNKGCYLGQETIARLDALGQVQKKLVVLSIPASVVTSAQDAVQDENGKEIGAITSVATGNSEGPFKAIAMIRRSHFQIGKQVFVRGEVCTVEPPNMIG